MIVDYLLDAMTGLHEPKGDLDDDLRPERVGKADSSSMGLLWASRRRQCAKDRRLCSTARPYGGYAVAHQGKGKK